MRYILIYIFSFFVCTLKAQILEDYFIPPLKIPIVFSGTFGELRSNHFHSGLDIKTQGKTGLDIHASAEGYVSRIKISEGGYGKALYVKHPNGYTTVYAHLKKFGPKIEAYVKKRQYTKESYTIELYPKASDLVVAKDEVIALSGNSGGSGGPHLHFEIRDGNSRPMNPILFGIDAADTRKPLVRSVWLYPLNEDAHVNGQNEPYRLKTTLLEDGSLKTKAVIACGEIGVGLNTVDQQNAANNKNGIYIIKSSVNGTPNFELEMKRFSFSETRYINRMIDYPYFIKNKSRITKLFVESNNPLSIYNDNLSDGTLDIKDQLSYKIDVSVQDAKGNSKVIYIPIEGQEQVNKEEVVKESSPFVAMPGQSFKFSCEYASLNIPKKALYDPINLDIEELPGNKLKIHQNQVPLHKYMNISFSLKDVANTKQSYIGRFKDESRPKYVGAKISGDRITARTREFGNFGIFTDTIAPVVKPVNFSNKKWISNNKTLKVSVQDRQTGVKSYRATINDRFALMEYDYKKNSLTYDFEDGISGVGENKLKVFVKDEVGNTTVYEASFFRKK